MVVWKSSATVSVAIPPIPSSAWRRMTAADPHQKAPSCRSLPGMSTSKNMLWSWRPVSKCWNESWLPKSWGVWTRATEGSSK